MALRVNEAIQKALDALVLPVGLEQEEERVYPVPVAVVDKVLQQHFSDLSSPSYALYLVNPRLPSLRGLQNVRYAYIADSPAMQVLGPDKKQAATCAVVNWVGTSRYAWIDVSAGPVMYGPRTSGNGVVTEFTVPRLERTVGQQTLRINTVPSHQVVADIASAADRASKTLYFPPLYRVPVPFKKVIAVHILVIYDGPPIPEDARSEEEQAKAPWIPEWAGVAELLTSLAMSGQQVDVVTHRIHFYDCELCVAAFTHSLKSHTSNVMTDQLRTQVHQYLDSQEMHDWLEHFDRTVWNLKDATAEYADVHSADISVFPVFIYDLQTPDIILLDRFHLAMSFEDMVIGIQTRALPAVIDLR